jgi:hypothetical protein
LKIDYVYQGLLLGTGPQVDPGYVGQIYIPLHNLTNQPVEIYLNESFVSIDFVRTGPLTLEHGVPETYLEFHNLYARSKRPIDLEKVMKKTNLHAYLQGSRPMSSLAGLVARFDKLETDFATKTAKMDSEFDTRRYVELAVVGFFVTLLAAFFYHVDRELRKTTTDTLTRYSDMQKDVERLTGEHHRTLSAGNARRIEALREDLDRTSAELQRLKDDRARERGPDPQQ